VIVADGFSCQTQIEQETGRRALHVAQVLQMALDHGATGLPGTYPERFAEGRQPSASLGLRTRRTAAAVSAGTVMAVLAGRGRTVMTAAFSW
jgi:hypothetical protein